MIKNILIGFLIVISVNCKKEEQVTTQSGAPPESTIYRYWTYLNTRDYRNALRCFRVHKEEYYDSSLIYPIPERIESLRVDSIISKKMINKTTYEIYYVVRFYSLKDSCFKYFKTGDRLRLTEKGWLIDEVLIH